MICSKREEQLNCHYGEGHRRGCSAARSDANVLKQYRNGGYMSEGWTDGCRGARTCGKRVQNHYDTGYRRGETAAGRDETTMLIDAQNDGAWREGWVDGYRGLPKGRPSILAKNP